MPFYRSGYSHPHCISMCRLSSSSVGLQNYWRISCKHSMYKYNIWICALITKPMRRSGSRIRGGAHLKKLGRAEGGANIFGVFRVKKHDFTPKNVILWDNQIAIYNNLNLYHLYVCWNLIIFVFVKKISNIISFLWIMASHNRSNMTNLCRWNCLKWTQEILSKNVIFKCKN
jgi:hypothetical protein